jgi:hypothetical protein
MPTVLLSYSACAVNKHLITAFNSNTPLTTALAKIPFNTVLSVAVIALSATALIVVLPDNTVERVAQSQHAC